ncbi:MAG: hypothetical protein WCV90_03440 [Candidatus Woesearchaeota archaeon]
MRIRTALSGLFLGATLMYSGSALAQQAANPYIRSTEIASPSEAVDPNVVITADGPVSVTSSARRTMAPEEFGALFGAEPTGAAAKAVLTAGADPLLTASEFDSAIEYHNGGQTLKPIYTIGSVGMEICIPGKKGKCVPCVPGKDYTIATSANGKGDDDLVTFVCPDQRAAKVGVPACNTLYEHHGVCLDNVLADAFRLTDSTSGRCSGKNTACYDASKAPKFATDEDLTRAVEAIAELTATVGQVQDTVTALADKTAEVSTELAGRIDHHTTQISELMIDVDRKNVPSWEWGLGVGYFNNGGNGAELFAFVGAPVVGDNGHLDLLVRGYLANRHDSDSYSVQLPTAVQQTTDVTDVRRYMDVVARFQWDMLGGYLNPLVELGAGWQKASQGRTIDLLGDVRQMNRDEHQFMGVLGLGATGRIYGPLSWYGRASGTTKAKAEGSVGLQLDF